MQLKFIYLAAGIIAGTCIMHSCVEINEELGKEYIPTRHQYDVYTDTIFFQDIRMGKTENLSGYSSSRITIGAVRDNTFGLTTRSSAFTIIPVSTEMDFGDNPRCTQFHFTAVRDTLSWPDESQAHIIQNINVYKLDETIGDDASYINSADKLKIGERVAPVFNYFGQDSLSFDFDTSFGDEYIAAIQNMDLGSVSDYVDKLHGIYITVDSPIAEGGRINMFDLAIQVSDYYISGNYAELKFRSDYGHRHDVDSSFLFFFGASAMQVYEDTDNPYITPQQTPQSALNLAEYGELSENMTEATDKIYIEGGSGVKPVIQAREIKEKLLELFANEGIDPDDVIIHKASVVLPYDFNSADYDKMYLYPDRLSPTCRITSTDEETGEELVRFAGLTDSSVETENQGDINRSLNCYAPDISHHVQEILRRADDSNYDDFDVWMLTMANEVTESESTDNSALDQYYSNLMYYNYYNSLYNPYGYGGYYDSYYGGYYDSYYGMSNYYNYMLAAQYASTQSNSSTTVSMQLDKDRYYRGILRGPEAEPSSDGTDRTPILTVTYSVSKTSGLE